MRPSAVIALLVFFAGCSSGPEPAPVIGEAFAGPASVTLRQELHPRSAVTATVKHGERLEVVQRRRRFFKVRTAQGVEGWTDARQLLAPAEMARLQRVAERSAGLPSQGRATVFDALNIHTEPNRQAPSFAQIPEKGSVDVLAHKLAPRVPYNSPILAVGTPEPPPPRKKPKKKQDDRLPPPPMPTPPPLPPNWLELSKTPDTGESSPAAEAPKPAPRVPMEDWSLVRTPDGKAGWVLTGPLIMAIPDEVAQYAEGHRITSYFSVGEVRDDDQTKTFWLWTTLSTTRQPYQFDGFRIFVWSLRRHRYETAYIERNVEGYFPATVQQEDVTEGRQKFRAPTFSLILREKDGSLARRTYAFINPRVKLLRKESWTPPPDDDKAGVPAAKPAAEKGSPTGLKESFEAWRKRWFRR